MRINAKQYAQLYLQAVSSTPADKRAQVARNFWQLVWRQGHFKWQKNIVNHVKDLLRQQKGIVLAEVATPQALSEREQVHLVSQLNKALDKTVEIANTVKPHLLAGAVVTIDYKRYDASLKGRIDALYNALVGQTNLS